MEREREKEDEKERERREKIESREDGGGCRAIKQKLLLLSLRNH